MSGDFERAEAIIGAYGPRQNPYAEAFGLSAIPAPASEVLGAEAEETVTRNPLPSLHRFAEQQFMGGQTLSPKEADELYGVEFMGQKRLTFDRPIREDLAAEQRRLKLRELRRQDVMGRASGGVLEGAARFGTGLLMSAIDPLNIASAFIPAGYTRYAAALARAATPLERAAVRGVYGGFEGAVGAAAVEPIIYGVAKYEKADYDLTDSLMNIAFGTALGGGLHIGVGALADRLRPRTPERAEARDQIVSDSQPAAPEGRGLGEAIDAFPAPVKEDALRAGVADYVQDGEVRNVASVLLAAEEARIRNALMGSTAVGRAMALSDLDFRPTSMSEAVMERIANAIDPDAFGRYTRASSTISDLRARLARVEELASRPADGDVNAPDAGTEGRLAAIEDELNTANLPNRRRAALESERAMLRESMATQRERVDAPRTIISLRGDMERAEAALAAAETDVAAARQRVREMIRDGAVPAQDIDAALREVIPQPARASAAPPIDQAVREVLALAERAAKAKVDTPSAAAAAERAAATVASLDEIRPTGQTDAAAISSDIAARVAGIGVPRDQAEAYGAVMAARYVARARRLGREALELYRETAPMFERRASSLVTPGKQGSLFQSPTPDITSTAEFERWFGDSKVVDENGRPLVVYHGTLQEFDAFDPSARSGRSFARSGLYFTDNPEIAASYAKGDREAEQILKDRDEAQAAVYEAEDGEAQRAAYARVRDLDARFRARVDEIRKEGGPSGAQILPVYLSLQNPMVVDAEGRGFRNINGGNHNTGRLANPLFEEDRSGKARPDTPPFIPDPRGKVENRDINWYVDEAKRLGHDGLIVKNVVDVGSADAYGAVRDAGGSTTFVAFESSQVKSVNNRGTFDPNDPRILMQEWGEEPRGAVTFRDDARALITLFEKADASTLLHETGHIWLEELRADATLANAPAQLRNDWGIIARWLDVAEGESLTTAQHEQFARAVETYFLEGRAPSAELQGVFSRFRDWLRSIYRSIVDLGVEIDGDVRGVLDRMLSVEERRADAPRQPRAALAGETGLPRAPEVSRLTEQQKAALDEADTLIEQAEAEARAWDVAVACALGRALNG